MPHPLATLLRLAAPLALAACTTFSAARPADVPLGSAFHLKVGAARPNDAAVSWFSAVLDDCPMCEVDPVGQAEIGWTYGWRGGSRKYSAGVFLDGIAPSVDAYAQLRESPRTNWGVGARGGLDGLETGTAKLYLLYDRRAGAGRLLLSPGLYWFGNLHDPDGIEHGRSPAWMAGVTQAVGYELEAGRVTWTPQLALVGVHGEIGGDAGWAPGRRRLKFDDVFLTASIGVALRREPR